MEAPVVSDDDGDWAAGARGFLGSGCILIAFVSHQVLRIIFSSELTEYVLQTLFRFSYPTYDRSISTPMDNYTYCIGSHVRSTPRCFPYHAEQARYWRISSLSVLYFYICQLLMS